MTTLTTDEFRDALAKGLGRTMLALREPGGPERYGDVLIGACVENLQWDRQLEANRAGHLRRLVVQAGLLRRVVDAIRNALPDTREVWDHDLMVDLLEEFAREGNAQAWHILLSEANGGDERAQDNLALVGEEGLAWVVQNVLPSLDTERRWRVSMWLPDEEADDVTETQRRLRELLKRDEAALPPRRSGERRPLTAREFLRRLDTHVTDYGTPYAFARIANRRQLKEAAERLLREDRRVAAFRLAAVFEHRPFPLPARLLIAQATHPKRGPAACRVLGTIDSPAVRHAVRRLLRVRPLPENAIEAWKESIHRGDERDLVPALTEVALEGRRARHNAGSDLLDLMKRWSGGAWHPFAEWVYEHSPCAYCRAKAVRLMAEWGTLPSGIREEGIDDAEPEIRELCAAPPPQPLSPGGGRGFRRARSRQ